MLTTILSTLGATAYSFTRIFLTCALSVLAGCAGVVNADADELNAKFADFAEQNRQHYAQMTFEEFEASIFKEPIPEGQYIVNGDTTIPTKKELKEFFERQVKVKPPPPRSDNPEFAIVTVGGVDAIWSVAAKHALTYCISTSFDDRYNQVVQAMTKATEEWERYGDLGFHHLSHEDGDCDAKNENVVFDVRPVDFAAYFARAFRPYYARRKRNILIDDMIFALPANGKMQLVGVLRHELGHIIGARHEHTRPESGKCFEDNNFRPITDYDAYSVMHYVRCNGRADRAFQLTPSDKAGVSCVYGPAPGAEHHVDASLCKTGRSVLAEHGKPIKAGEQHRYGPIDVKPGSEIRAAITNSNGQTGPDTGDADLYLNFDQPPHRLQFACRPRQEDANETCETIVPDGVSAARLLVEGHEEVTYDLTVSYVKPKPSASPNE